VSDAVRTTALETHRTSPSLLLAMLGPEATRRLRGALEAHGLSPRQIQLLGLLDERGPTGQRELGSLMDVAPAVLVGLINPLEQRRLVRRRRHPDDRRRHVVAVTPTGSRLFEEASLAQHEAENALLSALGAEQRELLAALLLAVRDDHINSLAAPCDETSAPAAEKLA
jgi:DNA-binding MarR family transcriptional regulator